MKHLFLPLLLLSLLTAATGCGESNGPVEACDQFFQALSRNDLAAIKAVSCDRAYPDFKRFVDRNVEEGLQFEYKMEFVEESRDGDTAKVRVMGEIISNVGKGGSAYGPQGSVYVIKQDGQWKYCSVYSKG